MVADSAVIARISKLLALAADASNEHEAALAAARAQDLLHKHNLDIAVVESSTHRAQAKVKEEQDRHEVKPGSGKDWRIMLADAIADYGYCKVLTSSFSRWLTLWWIGRPTEIEAAKFTYVYLERELERMALEYSRTRWAEAKAEAKAEGVSFHEYESHLKWRGEHPLTARRSWLDGAVAGVRTHLREEFLKRTSDEASHALILVRGTEVREFVDEKYPKLKNRRVNRTDTDYRAYREGQVAGYNMRARRGIGSNTRGEIA